VPKHGQGTQPREHNGGQLGISRSGENLISRQENQEPKVILPSYLNDILREGAESRWLEPKKDKKVLKGWDSLAEYAFDMADVFPKPNTPNIPKDDIDAIDEDNLNAHGMTADQWEQEVLSVLNANEDRHLIPEFQRHMQEYRRAVKAIVQLWRENGLL
jgi:hypothetical protein